MKQPNSSKTNKEKGIQREGYKHINYSNWATKLDTPCCLLMPCSRCQELRVISDFYIVNKRSRKDIMGNYRASMCKECQNKAYIEIEDQRIKLLYGARQRATQNDWEFNLEVEDIIIPEMCPILGIKLEPAIGKGSKAGATNDFAPSIDRINGEKGYTKGNICVISKRANFLKKHATIEEVSAIYTYMVKSTDPKESDKNPPYIKTPLISKELMIRAAEQFYLEGN